MAIALGIIWAGALILAVFVFRQSGKAGMRDAGRDAAQASRPLLIRLPCALLMAAFLVQIVPLDMVSSLIGREAGTRGIVIAALAGGIFPGGPMVVFPVAAVFEQAGAGLPQLVAMIAGWSIFAINRLLVYEAPIMGWRFAVLRNISCLALPVLAGFGAELILGLGH